MKTSAFIRLFAASSLIVPLVATQAGAEDSVSLLTRSARAMRAVDAALDAGRESLPEPDRIVTGSIAKAAPDSVDLAALYYYAGQNRRDRVEKEAARLRLKYPDFELPADLYADPAVRNVDEAPLWALYDANDFEGIDREVQRLSRTYSGWQPSADFHDKLARRKQRVTMTGAYERKDWAGVIEAGNGIDPVRETEADLMWMMIDAYRETGISDGLLTLYRGILTREGEARLPDDILVATLQKATQDFSAEDIRAAVARLGTTPAMMAKLQPVSLGLLRREVGDFNADRNREAPLPEADIMKLRAVADAQKAPADLSLLGWYYLKLKQPVEGARWFRQALDAEANADNAKGLYLSLAQQKLEEEAYAVAAAHLRDLSSDPEFLMNALSLRFGRAETGRIDADVVTSYSDTIMETKSAAHAEILGWYAYNSRQFEAAEAWFAKSMEWEQAPARLKGLVLAKTQLGKKAEIAVLRQAFEPLWPAVFDEVKVADAPKARPAAAVATPEVVAVAATAKPARAAAAGNSVVQASYYLAFKARRYQACVEDLQSIEARQPLSTDAALIKGWCLLGLDRLAEARDAFAGALRGKGEARNDAAYGMALTLLRGKLTDEADSIVSLYPLSAERDREVKAEIYWQRARSAFDRKLYQRTLDALNARLKLTPEPADLSMLRGWSHYHLGRVGEARAIFSRLSQAMGNPAARQALEMTALGGN